jgi:hypothetical protein
MSLEYIAMMDCPVKQQTKDDYHLKVKTYRQCLALNRILREQGKSREEVLATPVETLTLVRGKVDGKSEAVCLGDMAEQVKPFVAEGRHHCPQCTFGVEGITSPFGCYDSINYPISARAEEWLMNRLALHGGEDSLILTLISKNKISGKALAKGRPGGLLIKRPASLFERENPVEVKVGGRNGRAVNANQVVELIIELGQWQPHVMLNFLKDFGVIDASYADDAEKELVIGMLLTMTGAKKSDAPKSAKNGIGPFLMTDEADADTSIIQFQRFFHVMYLAYNQQAIFVTKG